MPFRLSSADAHPPKFDGFGAPSKTTRITVGNCRIIQQVFRISWSTRICRNAALSFWSGKRRQAERKLSTWSLRCMAIPFRELYHWTISRHFLRRKCPQDVCVILRAGTSVGDSAANSHFEAHVRLPPTDDDDIAMMWITH